jgi:hypothetical protein
MAHGAKLAVEHTQPFRVTAFLADAKRPMQAETGTFLWYAMSLRGQDWLHFVWCAARQLTREHAASPHCT